jgi:hypothetical protein
MTNLDGYVTFTGRLLSSRCRLRVENNYGADVEKEFDVEVDNNAPYFTSGMNDDTVAEGIMKYYYIYAGDPDGDTVNFEHYSYEALDGYRDLISVSGSPYGYNCFKLFVEFPNNRLITGNLRYRITIRINDGNGGTNQDSFVITVNDNDDGTCLLAGTKITMADGTTKMVEDIRVGDIVLSYDEENKELTASKVIQTMQHTPEEMSPYYMVINEKLKITPNHIVFINNEWKPVGEIKIGDVLTDINGEPQRVLSIERIYQKVTTYDFGVENTHNYYAEDILVHNKVA